MRALGKSDKVRKIVALLFQTLALHYFEENNMDKKDIEGIKEQLLEINKLISQLDPSIRAAAFEILAPYYFSHKQHAPVHAKATSGTESSGSSSTNTPDTSDLGAFISAFDTNKPVDNVMLLVAWLYSNYGTYPITAKEIKELGDSCGLIVPARPDNTMRQAKNSGKSLFNQQAKGWQLTVSGEMFLKENFKVKKGNKLMPKE